MHSQKLSDRLKIWWFRMIGVSLIVVIADFLFILGGSFVMAILGLLGRNFKGPAINNPIVLFVLASFILFAFYCLIEGFFLVISRRKPKGKKVASRRPDFGPFTARYERGFSPEPFDISQVLEDPSQEFIGEVGISRSSLCAEGEKPWALDFWLFDRDQVRTESQVVTIPGYAGVAKSRAIEATGKTAVEASLGDVIRVWSAGLELAVKITELKIEDGAFKTIGFEYSVNRRKT